MPIKTNKSNAYGEGENDKMDGAILPKYVIIEIFQ